MSAFLDSHFTVTMVLYPFTNFVRLGLFLFGFGIARTPLKRAFGILSVATVLLLVHQILSLMYFLKTSLKLDILSVSTVRTLFPVQACMEYVAILLDIVGVVLLVFAAKKRMRTEGSHMKSEVNTTPRRVPKVVRGGLNGS